MPDLMLARIGQIAVVVQDVERAAAFYRDVLGLRLLFTAPPGLAFFDCGGVRLMLSRPEGAASAAGTSVLYYVVAGIHAAYDTLRERGVQFEDAPHLVAKLPDHDLWLVTFRDSEGNLVALMDEVRPPA
ncbi:MAG: VOC family protein [Gemmatirosa sp.]|nr:VOC family protein [Gemmatirosa sp.]